MVSKTSPGQAEINGTWPPLFGQGGFDGAERSQHDIHRTDVAIRILPASISSVILQRTQSISGQHQGRILCPVG